ncbi:MAG: RNA methyltransferase [Campylobacterales bacterium]|nr:RNA methyltransferase [Campylobacterales bacterium]
MNDSEQYKEKKARFASMITFYGRNVAEELLEDRSVQLHKLHLAESNRREGIILKLESMAKARGVEIAYHSKEALSRISKNAKQDQGVAIDVMAQNYRDAAQLLAQTPQKMRLLALDGVQNPQNLGMIIRSAAAGTIDGIILPRKSSAKLSPLVMKASAGTLFKIDIYHCDELSSILKGLRGFSIYQLSSHAPRSLFEERLSERSVFVLGNESEGVSGEVGAYATHALSIPMHRGVESLNVAVAAGLLAFLP